MEGTKQWQRVVQIKDPLKEAYESGDLESTEGTEKVQSTENEESIKSTESVK